MAGLRSFAPPSLRSYPTKAFFHPIFSPYSMKKTLLFFLAFVCLVANAQTELLYWSGTNYGTASLPRAGVGVIAEISGTESISGLTPLNDSRGFLVTSNMAATLDPQTAPYLKYSVTLAQALKLERFVLGGYSYFPYTTHAQLRWSRDNFASSLGEFTYTTYYSVSSVALPSSGTVPAGTVEFRVYFYGAQYPTNISVSQSQPGFNSNADATPSGCIPAWGHAVALYGQPPCHPSNSNNSLAVPSSALPFSWNGLSFAAAGTQTAHLANAGGCDSAATLQLLVDAPGAALHFDGMNDVATLPASNRFDLPAATVEAWVKRDALNGQNVCLLGSRAFAQTRFSVHLSDNSIGLWNGSSYNSVYAGTFTPGTWYHVAVVIGAANADVYLNGTLLGSTGNGMGTATGLPFSIGAANPDGSGNEQFNGSLDEVRVWSRALASCEIEQTYTGELDGPQGGLLAYYRANQGIAGANNSAVTTLADASGNGLDATLVNMSRSGNTSNFDAPGAVTSGQYVTPTACHLVYPGAPFCAATGTGLPQHLAVAGARFHADPAGLQLDEATGAIDLAASTAGTYTVYFGNNESSAATTVVLRPATGLSPVANQSLCSETYSNPVGFPVLPGLQVQWTNNNPAIGLPESGSGDIPEFYAMNPDTAAITGYIHAFAVGGTGCSFKPVVFRYTVRPTPQIPNWPGSQDLCAGSTSAPVSFDATLPNTTFSWFNDNNTVGLSASGTGTVPAFTAQNNSGFNETWAGIMVQPTRGGCSGYPVWYTYHVSAAVQSISYPSASYCTSGTVRPTRVGSPGGLWLSTPAGLSLDAYTGVVNLAASQPGLYTITYDLGPVTSCSTSARTTLEVKAQGGVNPVSNQAYCSGVTTAPVVFTGTGSGFAWTNDNPAVGLPASGTGNLPAFTTINNGHTPVFANIKVYATGGCSGKAMGFRITVNPCGPVTTVSPNPASGGTLRINYSGTAASLQVEVQDGFGQNLLPAQRFSGSTTQVNVAALRPGTYFVVVTDLLSGTRTRTQLVKF